MFSNVQKFRFEGVDKNGKHLSGVVISADSNAARKKLEKEGIAMLSLNVFVETKAEQITSGNPIFEFEGMGKNENRVKGNIEAEDEYEAYKKLRTEYELYPMWIIDKTALFEEKERAKKNGIPTEIELQFEIEQDEKKESPDTKKKKKKNDEQEIRMLLERKKTAMDIIKKEIEELIAEIETLLEKHGTCILDEKKREIQAKIDALGRLRNSNSIEHLEAVMRGLFEIIVSDNIFTPLKDKVPEFELHKNEFRNMSVDLAERFKKRLSSLKIQVSAEYLNKLVELTQTGNIKKIFDFLSQILLYFLSFWVFIFWWNILKLFLIYDLEKVKFIFSSHIFWLILIFGSLLYVLTFFNKLLNAKFLPFQKRMAIYAAIAIGMIVLFLEFPIIFFWTK